MAVSISEEPGNSILLDAFENQAIDTKVVDEQASVQEAMLQSARALKALHQATVALLSTLELETLLGKILDAAISAIPAAEKGQLYLIARDTGKLEMRAVLGYTETDPRIRKLTRLENKGYVAKVVNRRVPLLIQQDSDSSTTRSIIAVPLILDDHVLGAISLETSHPQVFSQSDLHLLANFAATATAAIRNAQLHAEVQRLAITDALTGVYNRRGLFELGEREVMRSQRFDRPLAAILMDVDNLKTINDTFGHAAGDRVLCFVAEQCQIYTRKIDIVSRLGGDEFALLLPEDDLFEASSVAKRLLAHIAEVPIQFEESILTTSVSIGISEVTQDTSDLEALLKSADTALYTAKQAGRNQIAIR